MQCLACALLLSSLILVSSRSMGQCGIRHSKLLPHFYHVKTLQGCSSTASILSITDNQLVLLIGTRVSHLLCMEWSQRSSHIWNESSEPVGQRESDMGSLLNIGFHRQGICLLLCAAIKVEIQKGFIVIVYVISRQFCSRRLTKTLPYKKL